ncbi:hypothetical protein L227DRAFT_367784 [Lentinus tigrinus ALCF2SS1-6]|uniref:Transmembrane protein n=1 Tax=Lentinus tigrinus ALCF2SS1-6 TaxID=1328759 RepID=A0A5C2SLF3_9APHY|nr:hypothetical protein L227DRAFT_367784 [Lentinus tigrinus ALCF2SS1-6]
MPSDNIPRIILPDGVPVTEEPAPLPPSRSPTNRLFGGRGLLAIPPREQEPPVYVPLVPTDNSPNTPRKWTQEDQDEIDEKARKKAMNELVASWMDRLQLISVITTFFAAMESQLLGTTAPDPGAQTGEPAASQLANATLTGALVVHVFAAILSFLAAFFLIRYKLTAAKREERKVESGLASSATNSPPNGSGTGTGTGIVDADASRSSTASSNQPIWSSNPHLEQVGPFRRGQPPTHLLDHLHSVCMWLSIVGFVLALVGVLCFAWSRLALSGGVFASICMATCLITGVVAFFWPASSAHQ